MEELHVLLILIACIRYVTLSYKFYMYLYERTFFVNPLQIHQKAVEASYICFGYMCQSIP